NSGRSGNSATNWCQMGSNRHPGTAGTASSNERRWLAPLRSLGAVPVRYSSARLTPLPCLLPVALNTQVLRVVPEALGRAMPTMAGRGATVMGKQVLLTIPKLAEEYQIAESLLYRWAWAGELAGAVKLGGRWYVRRPAFERWLEDGGAGGAPPRQ